jgi:hypothetical protein
MRRLMLWRFERMRRSGALTLSAGVRNDDEVGAECAVKSEAAMDLPGWRFLGRLPQ